MSELIGAGEAVTRLGFFLGIFALVALWELALPRRRLSQPRWLRWYANLGIVALNTTLVWVLVPLAPVALAMMAESRGWGILNLVGLPFWLEAVLAIVVLDLVIYLQHVMFHALPALWRLHRMHHADLDFDVTTGFRFHPIEILVSLSIKMAAVVLIGPPAVAVLMFEILLNGTSMVTTHPYYQRHVRRERSEWPPAGCSPGSPWTADSLRCGNRLGRTCGCGSTPRLSA